MCCYSENIQEFHVGFAASMNIKVKHLILNFTGIIMTTFLGLSGKSLDPEILRIWDIT